MNRAHLQQLAEDRILDAQLLLSGGRWSGAYYLAGYAVECALKSCVLAHIERTGIIFQDKRFAERCWTHNIEELATQAGLMAVLGTEISLNADLGNNWLIVKDWSETSRYERKSQLKAQELFLAVNDGANGVLPWIKNRW